MRVIWAWFLAVGLPFFRSEARRRALLGTVLLVGLLASIYAGNVVNSYVGRDFVSALAERNVHDFYFYAALLAGVFGVLTILEALARYAEIWLGIAWREWLTRRLLDRYLAARTYLRLADRHEIDNPDERISEDVKTFTASSLSILVLLINGLMTLIAFSGVLWSINPWLFLTALGYSAAGSIGTIFLGRRLVRLNHQQLQKEGDFRYGLGRVREHAHAVAQVAGEEEQKGLLGRRLERLIDNSHDINRVSRNVGFFTTAYGYLPQIIPVLLAGYLYIQDKVEFGVVTQATMAFSQVQGAFSIIVTQFQQLVTYAAVIGRLGSLWQAMAAPGAVPPAVLPHGGEDLDGGQAVAVPPGPVVETVAEPHRVVFDHLSLWTPEEKRPLLHELSAELRTGQRLAITGAPAAAKAALLATAGLWQDGCGQIHRPADDHVMFLSTRVAETSGRLRDIVLHRVERQVSDEEIRSVLAALGLGALLVQPGGLDADRDWARVLTGAQWGALNAACVLLA
ncbi:hypothetical protein AYO40_06560, partial [Planctomycetaceae bacterium SCGC AG-212-D15]